MDQKRPAANLSQEFPFSTADPPEKTNDGSKTGVFLAPTSHLSTAGQCTAFLDQMCKCLIFQTVGCAQSHLPPHDALFSDLRNTPFPSVEAFSTGSLVCSLLFSSLVPPSMLQNLARSVNFMSAARITPILAYVSRYSRISYSSSSLFFDLFVVHSPPKLLYLIADIFRVTEGRRLRMQGQQRFRHRPFYSSAPTFLFPVLSIHLPPSRAWISNERSALTDSTSSDSPFLAWKRLLLILLFFPYPQSPFPCSLL